LPALREEVAVIRERGGGNPRIHPNGFVQLDLEPVPDSWQASHQRGHSGAARRLHIWNPPEVQLPRQETVNEIHDHVFDMRSTVVKGLLMQKTYRFAVGGFHVPTHQLYRAVYNKSSDSRLEALHVYGVVEPIARIPVPAGHSYTQGASTFHDSGADGLVVTVMEKTAIRANQAHVLVPKDIEPDNEFDRASAAPAELVWEAIERSLV
jgi:hypothetical protein